MTFDALADRSSKAIGHALAIPVMAACIALAFVALGLDVTNIAISIISLLLLVLLQHSQNKDGMAIQAKIDELIKGVPDADNALIALDKRTEAEIEEMRR
jgi:low affinity Fe/Cu permease